MQSRLAVTLKVNSGEPIGIPPAQRTEFDQALAAHQALTNFLDETPSPGDACDEDTVLSDVSEHYELERELGRGGMGVVYLARQRSLDRRVALTVLRPGERTFGTMLKQFRDEAQHLARLRHPHIVSIHEVGEADGEPYFTLDYIDGEPLSALIGRGALPPSQALAVLKQVADAVQHAHRQGIIRRDLKPGNVCYSTSRVMFLRRTSAWHAMLPAMRTSRKAVSFWEPRNTWLRSKHAVSLHSWARRRTFTPWDGCCLKCWPDDRLLLRHHQRPGTPPSARYWKTFDVLVPANHCWPCVRAFSPGLSAGVVATAITFADSAEAE